MEWEGGEERRGRGRAGERKLQFRGASLRGELDPRLVLRNVHRACLPCGFPVAWKGRVDATGLLGGGSGGKRTCVGR